MLADNVGYGEIGAYGAGEIRGMPTPRIDPIAAGTATDAIPRRAGVHSVAGGTNERAIFAGSGLSSVIVAGTPNTLQASEVTLGELFKIAGYATAITGKWHLGSSEVSWPTRQGFDEVHIGVFESTDGTLYRESMERAGMPRLPSPRPNPTYGNRKRTALKKERPYTVEYRRQVEGDIAKAVVISSSARRRRSSLSSFMSALPTPIIRR